MGVLAWAGRHATGAMAVGVLAGLALPPLATLARPLLVPTLLIPLAIALVRLDWSAIAAWRQRSGTIAALLVFVLGISPLVVWLLVSILEPLGFPRPLAQALILMAASSPIVSNVALALILRLDAPLAVVVVMLATALVPFTLPPIAGALAGIDVELPVLEFSLRLAALVGGAFAAAALVRRFVPRETLAANADWLDGFTVVNLLLFGLAIMDGVTAFALERPGYVALALLAAYAFNLALQAGAGFVFRSLGTTRALTVALLAGNCNMGLVLVALDGRASFEITVFFAIAQIPMYTLPALLGPVYARLRPADGPRR